MPPKTRPEENLPLGWRPRRGPIPRAGVVCAADAGNQEIPNIALPIRATHAECRLASRLRAGSSRYHNVERPQPLGKELRPLPIWGLNAGPVVGKSGV